MTTQALVTLSAGDLHADPAGEPRILDIDLAARLGFVRGHERNIRKLIVRRQAELEVHGTLMEVDLDARGAPFGAPRVAKFTPPGAPNGAPETRSDTAPEPLQMERLPAVKVTALNGSAKPSQGFLLNRNQALAIVLRSRASAASAVHERLIHAFDAYRKGPAPLSEAEKLPPLMIGMTSAVTVKVEIHDRAGLRDVQGRDLESPATKAKLRKATVEVFLEMYTVRCAGVSITRKELMASWQECRTENDLPRMEVRDLFRLVAEAGLEDDGESFHGLRYKMIPGVTPQLTQRRGHTGEPARLAALAAPSRPAALALPLTGKRG